jgi:hypothetical protein
VMWVIGRGPGVDSWKIITAMSRTKGHHAEYVPDQSEISMRKSEDSDLSNTKLV